MKHPCKIIYFLLFLLFSCQKDNHLNKLCVDPNWIAKEYDLDYKLNRGSIFEKYFHMGLFSNIEKDDYITACERLIDYSIEPLEKLNNKNKIKILDLGCGTGYVSQKVLEKYPKSEIIGIDISNEGLNIANEHNKNVCFLLMDAHKMQFQDKNFDFVLCIESLFHCDKYVVLKEIYRVLADDGVCSICDFYSKGEYYDKIPYNSQVFPIDEWINVLKNVGFKNIKIVDFSENTKGSYKFWENRIVQPVIKESWLQALENLEKKTGYINIICYK